MKCEGDFCAGQRQRRREFYVVIAPRTAAEQLCVGDAYPRNMAHLQQVVQDADGTLLDMNAVHPDVYRGTDAEFVIGLIVYSFSYGNTSGAFMYANF